MFTILITNLKTNKYFVGVTISTDNQSEYEIMIKEQIEIYRKYGYDVDFKFDTYSPPNVTITNNVCRIYISPFKKGIL